MSTPGLDDQARIVLTWLYGSLAGAARALGLDEQALTPSAESTQQPVLVARQHLAALQQERDTGLAACIAAVQALSAVEDVMPAAPEAATAREQLALSKARLLVRYIEPLQRLERSD